MRIFGRSFHFPIYIHKTSTSYGSPPNLTIRWDKSGSMGTMPTTSYTLEIATPKNRWQWSFVWRPSVTRYWWKQSGKKKNLL